MLRRDGEPNFRFSVRSSVQRSGPPVKKSCRILTEYRRALVVFLDTCALQVCTVRSRAKVGAVSQVVRIVLLETMHVHSHLVSISFAVVPVMLPKNSLSKAFSFDTQQYDFFSYAQNATICDDGTICMNPGNRTCCAQGKGKREVHYNNNAAMPTGVAQLDHYYANGDYRGTAALRTTLPPASQNALANKTGTALPATTTGPPSSLDSSSNRSSNNYSRGIRAGVGAGIGASLGTMLIVLLVIWYRRRRPNLAGGSSSTIGNLAKRSELGCEWVGEMDAGPPPPLKEMDENCKSGKTLVQEMPGLIWQEIQTSPTPNISVKHKAVNSP